MAMDVPARVIKEIMGHSSITMTTRYQHVIESVPDDAAERLARIFPAAAIKPRCYPEPVRGRAS
jgi:hypothetical protein